MTLKAEDLLEQFILGEGSVGSRSQGSLFVRLAKQFGGTPSKPERYRGTPSNPATVSVYTAKFDREDKAKEFLDRLKGTIHKGATMKQSSGKFVVKDSR